MSYPCSGCQSDGLTEPKQVRRKAELCSRCREKYPHGLHGGEPEEQRETLSAATIEDIADGTLRMLHATQVRLEKRMLSGRNFNSQDAGEAVKLAKAIAVSIKELRILREQEHRKLDQADNDEMGSTLVGWFKIQSRSTQHALLQDMVGHYRAQAGGQNVGAGDEGHRPGHERGPSRVGGRPGGEVRADPERGDGDQRDSEPGGGGDGADGD